MEEKFDFKELQSRIAEVKQESEESTEFIKGFLECLLRRHDLAEILHKDHEFHDTPEEVTKALKEGRVPEEEDLKKMTTEAQDYLGKDCVHMCGLGAISWYSDNMVPYKDMDDEEKPFTQILEMGSLSAGHQAGVYLICAFALLMGNIPPPEMIMALTNNFDSSHEQLEANMDLYNHLCVAIYQRYTEDLGYYWHDDEDDD